MEKCPKCEKMFQAGGVDRNGFYYYCVSCRKKYRKDENGKLSVCKV